MTEWIMFIVTIGTIIGVGAFINKKISALHEEINHIENWKGIPFKNYYK